MLIALFSQYLTKVDVPLPQYSKDRGGFHAGRFPLFRIFPVSIFKKKLVREMSP